MLKVFSIYDIKAETYMEPVSARAIGEGIRNFEDALTDNRSSLSKHPDDFILYELGEFNEDTGLFNLLVAPRELMRGASLKKPDDGDDTPVQG